MSAEELMSKAGVKNVPTYNVDGYFWTKQPYDVFANGEQTKVPLLIGGNNQEMNAMFILRGKPATIENLKEAARAIYGDATNSSSSTASTPTLTLWDSRATISQATSSSTTLHGNGETCTSSQAVSQYIVIATAIHVPTWY